MGNVKVTYEIEWETGDVEVFLDLFTLIQTLEDQEKLQRNNIEEITERGWNKMAFYEKEEALQFEFEDSDFSSSGKTGVRGQYFLDVRLLEQNDNDDDYNDKILIKRIFEPAAIMDTVKAILYENDIEFRKASTGTIYIKTKGQLNDIRISDHEPNPGKKGNYYEVDPDFVIDDVDGFKDALYFLKNDLDDFYIEDFLYS